MGTSSESDTDERSAEAGKEDIVASDSGDEDLSRRRRSLQLGSTPQRTLNVAATFSVSHALPKFTLSSSEDEAGSSQHSSSSSRRPLRRRSNSGSASPSEGGSRHVKSRRKGSNDEHDEALTSDTSSSSSSDNRLTKSIKDLTAFGRSKLKKHITQRGRRRASASSDDSTSSSSSSTSTPSSTYGDEEEITFEEDDKGRRKRQKEKRKKKSRKRVSYFIEDGSDDDGLVGLTPRSKRDRRERTEVESDSEYHPPSPPAEKGEDFEVSTPGEHLRRRSKKKSQKTSFGKHSARRAPSDVAHQQAKLLPSFGHTFHQPPIDPFELDHMAEESREVKAIVARTALVMAFSWDDPKTEPAHWAELLLQRKIPSPHSKKKGIQLWEMNPTLPVEAGELSPQFRMRLGWKDHFPQPYGLGLDIWRCRSLRLTENARTLLFPTAKVWGVDSALPAGGEEESLSSGEEQESTHDARTSGRRGSHEHGRRDKTGRHRVEEAMGEQAVQEGSCQVSTATERRVLVHELNLTSVEVVLYPLGTGLLVLHLDWLHHEPNKSATLDELRTWLFLAKFRHRVEGVLAGWTFDEVPDDGTVHHLRTEYARWEARQSNKAEQKEGRDKSKKKKKRKKRNRQSEEKVDEKHTDAAAAERRGGAEEVKSRQRKGEDAEQRDVDLEAGETSRSSDEGTGDQNGVEEGRAKKGAEGTGEEKKKSKKANRKQSRKEDKDGEDGEDFKMVELKAVEKASEGEEPRKRSPTERHFIALGRMAKAIYGDKPVTLAALGNWLIHLPDENPSLPPMRINRGQRCHHHTTIVVDKEPATRQLHECLFHFRRAFGQFNRPPPSPDASTQGKDKVLVHRRNRYIGLSREGTVCMSWPMSDNIDFDVRTWPSLFQGIYLLLALQVHAEQAVLLELGNLSIGQADLLRMDSHIPFVQMERYRVQLRELATLMVRYTLSMSSDECGGRSEYAHFFAELRLIFGIPSVKEEIREQIDDVLAIVESGYLEEQKKVKRKELEDQIAANKSKQLAEKQREKKRRRFELFTYMLTTVALPFVMIGGLLGMNVEGFPSIDFYDVLGICIGVSAFLLLVFGLIYVLYFRSKKRAKRRKKKLKEKIAKIKESAVLLRPSMEARRARMFSEDGTRESRGGGSSFFASFDFTRRSTDRTRDSSSRGAAGASFDFRRSFDVRRLW